MNFKSRFPVHVKCKNCAGVYADEIAAGVCGCRRERWEERAAIIEESENISRPNAEYRAFRSIAEVTAKDWGL